MACLTKTTELYFTDGERSQPCSGEIIDLGRFWAWHRSANLYAEICAHHAAIIRARDVSVRGYLAQKIRNGKVFYDGK